MKKFCTIAAILFLAFAASCGGGGGTSHTDPIPNYTSITGNWELVTTSGISSNQPSLVGGSIISNGGTVTGIVHVAPTTDIFGTGCFNLYDNVALSGTIDTNNNVTLTSASINGQVIAATLTVTPDGNAMQGTYTISGGCAGGDHGTIAGLRFPDVSGTWSGSVKSSTTNITQSLSGTLTQTTGANANGIFPISGTVNFPGSACFTSAQTVAPSSTDLGSFALGGVVVLQLRTTDSVTNAQVEIYVVAFITDHAAKTMSVAEYDVYGGTCDGDYGTTGTLTRP